MNSSSWGRIPKANQEDLRMAWRHDPLPSTASGNTLLPYGLGRSYGDSCLNDGGALVHTRNLDHLIDFDSENGIITCEAGMSLAEIIERIVPAGWFLPVSPGTKFVTVGGAIANDIHGKNHHRAGTFGQHLIAFELLRSDGSRLQCTANENAEWFAATIGGLGLTGLITRASFRLSRINHPFLNVEQIKTRNLDEFFDVAAESDANWDYTVSWIDCLAKGSSLGRGLFMRGNWAEKFDALARPEPPKGTRIFPFDAPNILLNRASIQAFNFAFYHKQQRKKVSEITHYEPFFYPLDSIEHWNRMYGKRGFYQYQCLVPFEESREPIRELLERIAASGMGSFLVVLKVFGDKPSPGLLSFPRPGVTLAMDFANQGPRTLHLFSELDKIVAAAGGSVYPAKDARMSPEHFRQYFPQWESLTPFIDPNFSSGFWRRVTGE